MLYVVPTPIGNLGDVTTRSIEVLTSVDYILAEDSRVTRKLLKHLQIDQKVVSFHAHNEHHKLSQILEDLKADRVLALVSDAGTPGISDPGFLLVRACHEENITVSTLPGASALIPALVNSGLPINRFHFEGFLPAKKGKQTRLKALATLPNTFVLYESPHRIVKTVTQLIEHCGPDRMACLNRELSKLHEEVKQSTLASLLEDLQSRPSIKGEIVLVVAGRGGRRGNAIA